MQISLSSFDTESQFSFSRTNWIELEARHLKIGDKLALQDNSVAQVVKVTLTKFGYAWITVTHPNGRTTFHLKQSSIVRAYATQTITVSELK